MITQGRLKEVLYYHPESGDFVWLVKTSIRTRVGDQAGCINPRGYIKVTVDSEQYMAHRLAVFYVAGEWPPHGVDHKEQPKHDNSWGNLRLATQSQNLRNAGPRCDSATGLKMIQQRKVGGSYTVQSRVNGKPRYFGSYKNLNDAIDVAAQVMLVFHSEFARA